MVNAMSHFTKIQQAYAVRLLTGLLAVVSILLLTGCKCNVKDGNQCSELSVAMTGSGSGRVTSQPEGIDCEPSCSQGFITGTEAIFLFRDQPKPETKMFHVEQGKVRLEE